MSSYGSTLLTALSMSKGGASYLRERPRNYTQRGLQGQLHAFSAKKGERVGERASPPVLRAIPSLAHSLYGQKFEGKRGGR
jgi:hypothetical protein